MCPHHATQLSAPGLASLPMGESMYNPDSDIEIGYYKRLLEVQMGWYNCSAHGLRVPNYSECPQCLHERLMEESMQRQEELAREQLEMMRERAAEARQQATATATATRPASGDLICSENLSKELLKAVLDSAMFNTSYDRDGDLVVTDHIRCLVLPSEQRDRIRLLTGYRLKSGAARAAVLEAANNINAEYVVIRASVADDVLYFDRDILVNDGIGQRAFALTVKRFCGIPNAAVKDHALELVE